MQKILPPPQRSVLVRNGSWTEAETLSELGIFGTFVKRGEEVLLSEEVSFLGVAWGLKKRLVVDSFDLFLLQSRG